MYQGDTLVASYTTDAEGSFISDYFISDSDWTLREISPSEGYLLDESVYTIPAEPGNFEIELNQIPISHMYASDQAAAGHHGPHPSDQAY